jgi:hypothetical protein
VLNSRFAGARDTLTGELRVDHQPQSVVTLDDIAEGQLKKLQVNGLCNLDLRTDLKQSAIAGCIDSEPQLTLPRR